MRKLTAEVAYPIWFKFVGCADQDNPRSSEEHPPPIPI